MHSTQLTSEPCLVLAAPILSYTFTGRIYPPLRESPSRTVPVPGRHREVGLEVPLRGHSEDDSGSCTTHFTDAVITWLIVHGAPSTSPQDTTGSGGWLKLHRAMNNPRSVNPLLIHRLFSSRERYRELQADIVQEESSHTINFINIDCSQLKAALVGHCSQWQAKLTGLLNQVKVTRSLDLFRGNS